MDRDQDNWQRYLPSLTSKSLPSTLIFDFRLLTWRHHAASMGNSYLFAALAWLVQRQHTHGAFPIDMLDKLFNPCSVEARARPLLPHHQALVDLTATSRVALAQGALSPSGQPRRQRSTPSQLELEAQFYKAHRDYVRCSRCRSFDLSPCTGLQVLKLSLTWAHSTMSKGMLGILYVGLRMTR